MESIIRQYDRIILGIDPGTLLMGYGVVGIKAKKPSIIDLGIIDLRHEGDHYLRLGKIYNRVCEIVDKYIPDELAIEAPFYGKNVQSMLKLGRAQGIAMAAALQRQIPIAEYEPRKIKQAITGNGAASKEQVCEMLRRTLNLELTQIPQHLDATDALAAAMCHFYESGKPSVLKGSASWAEYVKKYPDRVKK